MNARQNKGMSERSLYITRLTAVGQQLLLEKACRERGSLGRASLMGWGRTGPLQAQSQCPRSANSHNSKVVRAEQGDGDKAVALGEPSLGRALHTKKGLNFNL